MQTCAYARRGGHDSDAEQAGGDTQLRPNACPNARMSDAATRIARLIDDAGVACARHQHPPVVTIDEARATVPHLVVDLLKTVVFEIAGSDRRLLVAVDADRQVDYRSVATVAGCSRRTLRLMPAARVATELGFEIGGVGPFPVCEGARVILDAGIDADRRVKVGSGLCTLTLELDFADLVRVSAATVAPIAKQNPTS